VESSSGAIAQAIRKLPPRAQCRWNQSQTPAEIAAAYPGRLEVISGDGRKTDRKVIPATELPAFGKHRFQIPFDVTGKKWVRIAVWDSAGNGAMVQPVKLSGMTATTAAR